MSNIHLSTRLQQVVAQQAPTTPRRIPLGALAAVLVLALLLGSVAVGWRVLSEPRPAPTPAVLSVDPATPPAPVDPAAVMRGEAGARPQEDAPTILAAVTPVVETMRVLSEPRVDPTPTPRNGPRPTATRALRGGPLPTPQGATQ